MGISLPNPDGVYANAKLPADQMQLVQDVCACISPRLRPPVEPAGHEPEVATVRADAGDGPDFAIEQAEGRAVCNDVLT